MTKIYMIAYTYYERDPRVRRYAEALIKQGSKVDVISLKDGKQLSKEIVSGVQVFRVPLSKNRGSKLKYFFSYLAFFFLAFINLTRLYLSNRYDLVHVHNMPNILVFSALLPKIMGTPIILDIHDPMPELFGSIFSGKSTTLFQSILFLEEKLSIKFADQIITVNKEMSSLLTNRGVDPTRLEIIRNLPDPSMFFRGDNRLANHNNFTLVYAGTVSPRHQLELVLEVMSTLRDEMPDLHFLIVGDGPDIKRLKNLASIYKIENKVVFLGAVPVDKVAGILRNCDAAIASYSDDENGNLVFPTKAFEALEVGIPVICSKVNTVQQYLDSNTVFYFLPGDVNSLISQIRLIRQNPDLVMEKLNFSREFLSLNNWENEKQKYLQLVELMIKIK